MNIGILGGGGIRSPIIIKMLSEFDSGMPLSEVRILDVDSNKTEAILKLSSVILKRMNKGLNIVKCNNISEFSKSLNVVIFTIREGFEEGRAVDERICLRNNIIGQETTGAAGFAFASRTAPVLIKYSEEIKKQSPGCIIINFTNPAGIVVRALNLAGFSDVIGICDSSDAARIHSAELLNKDRFDFNASIIGLNHLSWTTGLFSNGKNILPEILNNERFYEIAHGPFNKELFVRDGLYKNEYLYYYYCKDEALREMLKEKETRGEYLLKKNRELIRNLREEEEGERLIEIYESYLNDRFSTYMSYAYHDIKRRFAENESEGYAEIALKIASAMLLKKNLNIPMIIPNRGTIPFLPDEVVVEKFCNIRNGKIEAQPVDYNLPNFEKDLIETISRYEELTARSIINKSFSEAIEALKTHPLIGEKVAEKVLKEFVDVHKKYFEEYHF